MKKNTPVVDQPQENGSPAKTQRAARLKNGELNEAALLSALSAFKRGDFSARLPEHWTGTAGKIADMFNDVIGMNQRMARELDRIGQVVGKEGRITQRASLGGVLECWGGAIGSGKWFVGGFGSSHSGKGPRHRGRGE